MIPSQQLSLSRQQMWSSQGIGGEKELDLGLVKRNTMWELENGI